MFTCDLNLWGARGSRGEDLRLTWISGLFAGFLVICGHPSVGLAQVDALLPYKNTIKAGPQMPIDGVYKISSTGTRIRIEGGRGYALDEWIQLFFRIRPNIVTMQNIQRVKAGSYTGYDLPLLSNAVLKLNSDGTLKVDVKTIIGPANFVLTTNEFATRSKTDQALKRANL